MRNLDDTTPEPYHIKFSTSAMEEAAALSPDLRKHLSHHLIQLADLAAFAARYSIKLSQVESMVADMDGLSTRYEVDERARTLTVLEIAETRSGLSGEHAVQGIK